MKIYTLALAITTFLITSHSYADKSCDKLSFNGDYKGKCQKCSSRLVHGDSAKTPSIYKVTAQCRLTGDLPYSKKITVTCSKEDSILNYRDRGHGNIGLFCN